MPLQPPKYPNILIYLKWANVNGSDEKFGQEEIKWFKKVREAMGGEGQMTDFPKLKISKHDFKLYGSFVFIIFGSASKLLFRNYTF